MNMIRILALVAAVIVTPAAAQAPAYPQTLPPNTVVGRLGIGPGPAEAIPFSKFQSGIIGNLGAGTFYGNPGASTAAISPWRIQDQPSIGTPDKSSDLLPIYDHATGAIKSVQPHALLNSICSTASSFLWNSAGTWVCRSTAQVALMLGLPISLQLYIPTPGANDTTGFTTALSDCNNAGGCTMVCPAGVTYRVTQVSLVSNMTLTGGCTVKQINSGTAPLLISSKTNVKVSGINITGTLLDNYATNGCGSPTPPCSGQTAVISGDNGITILSSNRIWIEKNYISMFGYRPINIQSSRHFWIDSNYLYSNALGIILDGGNLYFRINNNTFFHTSLFSLTPTYDQFSVAIGIDTTSSVSYAMNYYGEISNNTVVDAPYAQAILIHAGQFISVTGNIANNVSQGLSVGTFLASGATNQYISVVGNVFHGSQATSIPTESDVGIGISSGPPGDGYPPIKYVTVANNVVGGFNAVYKGANDGCIIINNTVGTSVTGNVCANNYANGIVLGADEINVLVNGNIIDGVTTAASNRNGIKASGSPSGIISSNLISNADNGVKINGTATNIKYTGLQQCLNVSTCTTP